MRQILITRSGKPRSLRIIESICQNPKPSEIRIDVKAIGINFSDLLTRIGLYPDAPKLPAVIGYEVSGIILETGSEVKQFKVGDHVTALTKFGGYSEQVTIPAYQAVKIKNNLSFEKSQQRGPDAARASAAGAGHDAQPAAGQAAAGTPHLEAVAREEADEEAEVDEPQERRARLVLVDAPRDDSGEEGGESGRTRQRQSDRRVAAV